MKRIISVMLVMLALSMPALCHAARIGDIAEQSVWEQMQRFITLQDASVRTALLGCVMLGMCCGLLGTLIVVRQYSLAGDTLAHAVLPGIALGYLWAMKKSPPHLFLGAVVAGVIGAVVVSLIQQTTRLKKDTALGLVLGGFYAIGILLITLMQNHMPGEMSGLKSFLFGSAAALNETDVKLIAWVTIAAFAIMIVCFGQFRIVSFDQTYARSVGIPERWFHYLLMLLLAWTVVAALQAVGVVLVSALLIIPAATARLLTERLHWMMVVSVAIGMIVSTIGAFTSFLGSNLPTGPFIILTAATLFLIAFIGSPRHGTIARWYQRNKQAAQIQRENILKAIFHQQEADDFENEWVKLGDLTGRRRKDEAGVIKEVRFLAKSNLIEWDEPQQQLRFREAGQRRASEIVRNHRLWELYLTNEANIAADHVHDDAEKIEHILGEDIVRQLEESLDNSGVDPHGKKIPALSTTESGGRS
ncbi:MAG: iron chelate uptake ABC transporter family permease subunit [Verrucomicrobiota bacterium]